MAPRREVLDSDDEDADFSPVKHPVAPPLADDQNDNGNNNLGTPRNRRAESTDPSFFRNVYEDQHVAADARQSTSSVAALSSELVSTSPANPQHDLNHVNVQDESSHLSSITDPVPASRRRQRRSGVKEVLDLTQVTTPGRPTPKMPADIWDFPASPEANIAGASSSASHAGSAKKPITIKLKKQETKRKSTLSSSIQSPGPQPALSVTQAEQTSDASPVEPRQKRRRISSSGRPGPSIQEVNLLNIPRSEDNPARDNNNTTPPGNSSSVVEDSLKARTTSLLVVPSTTMTTSQKDEYRFVSLSSEADRSHEPPHAFGQSDDDLHKSSGSATIKYPTPIEYASSGRRGPDPRDYGTASSSRPRRRQNVVDSDPHSSPDIISEHVAGPSGRSKGSAEDASTDYAPSSRPPRSAKRRAKTKDLPDELGPSSPVSENELPRTSGSTRAPSRKRQERDQQAPRSSAAQIHTCTDRQYQDVSAELEYLGTEEQIAAVPEEPPQKKTRGKKRKEVPSVAVVEGRLPDVAGQQADAAEPATKKRRGRPRKETQSQAIVIDDDLDAFQPDPEDVSAPLEGADETPKPKKRRGRPRKVGVAKSAEGGVVSNGNADVVQEREDAEGARPITIGTPSKQTVKETSAEDETTGALSERDSNSNIGASSLKPAYTSRDAVGVTAKENQATEAKAKDEAAKETKGGTPSSQLGKVQYRVGLSKKSRIAPLLKSFRK